MQNKGEIKVTSSMHLRICEEIIIFTMTRNFCCLAFWGHLFCLNYLFSEFKGNGKMPHENCLLEAHVTIV